MRFTYLIPVAALVSQACAVSAAHSLLLNRQSESEELSTIDGVHPECTTPCLALSENFDSCGAGESGAALDFATAQCMCTSDGFSVMEACITCLLAHVPAGEDVEATEIQLEASKIEYTEMCNAAGVPIAADGGDAATPGADADAESAAAANGAPTAAPNTTAAGSATNQTKSDNHTATANGSTVNDTDIASSDDAAGDDSGASRAGLFAAAVLAALAGSAALF